jgi:hypothetical protein
MERLNSVVGCKADRRATQKLVEPGLHAACLVIDDPPGVLSDNTYPVPITPPTPR